MIVKYNFVNMLYIFFRGINYSHTYSFQSVISENRRYIRALKCNVKRIKKSAINLLNALKIVLVI